MDVVSSISENAVRVKEDVVWVMRLREARDSGIDSGCWIARRAKTIWKPDLSSRYDMKQQEHLPPAMLEELQE